MAFKNVAIAGATGHIGKPVIKALLDSNKFNITVLTRADSPNKVTYPSTVKTAIVDFDKPDTLVAALKGQDAVISALTSAATAQQQVLLDAAVQAGVQRYLPSEFGSDTLNVHAAQLPVFGSKKKIEKQVEEYAAQGKITYTYVFNGPFLDFGLAAGFLGLDLNKKQLTYLDGGNSKFSTTTRDTVAKVVVGVLSKPEETKNRAIFVQDAAVSLKDLLRLSKQALGEDGWTEVDGGTTEATEKAGYEKLKAGQKDMSIFVGFLLCAVFREDYGGRFQRLDNELFGVSEMTEKEIIEVIREVNKA